LYVFNGIAGDGEWGRLIEVERIFGSQKECIWVQTCPPAAFISSESFLSDASVRAMRATLYPALEKSRLHVRGQGERPCQLEKSV
jgi:hypothetical protein